MSRQAQTPNLPATADLGANIEKLLSSLVSPGVASTARQAVNCPATLGSVVAPAMSLTTDLGPKIAKDVVPAAVSTAHNLIDTFASYIFGTIFLVIILILSLFASTRLFSGTSAFLIIIASFAVLYIIGMSFREAIRLIIVGSAVNTGKKVGNTLSLAGKPALEKALNAHHTELAKTGCLQQAALPVASPDIAPV